MRTEFTEEDAAFVAQAPRLQSFIWNQPLEQARRLRYRNEALH